MNKKEINKLIEYIYKAFPNIKELILIKVNKKTILIKFLDEIETEYTITLNKDKILQKISI